MSRPIVLVCDDDPIMVRLLELNVKRLDCEVDVCRNGDDVEPRMRARRPDLAIIDLMMPGKTGYELLAIMRDEPAWKDIPVVVVTGKGKGRTRAEMFALGAKALFTKPFSPAALSETVQRLLSETREEN